MDTGEGGRNKEKSKKDIHGGKRRETGRRLVHSESYKTLTLVQRGSERALLPSGFLSLFLFLQRHSVHFRVERNRNQLKLKGKTGSVFSPFMQGCDFVNFSLSLTHSTFSL